MQGPYPKDTPSLPGRGTPARTWLFPQSFRNKYLIPFVIALVLLAAIIAGRGQVDATGGAFPLTKHGGGLTDNESPCAVGVNRGLGSAYMGDCASLPNSFSYDYLNSEAGIYNSGECSNCHEPHTSFGDQEPEPNTASPGPQDYLLFYYPQSGGAGAYISLCNYCHNNISNINGSGSSLGQGRWGFYQGRDAYLESSHYVNKTNMYWPGTVGDLIPIHPRQSRLTLSSSNLGSCLNCHTPHGIKEKPGYEYDTSAVPANMHLQGSNLGVSADYLIPRQLIAWEEALCENCHDFNGPAAADIKSQLAKRDSGGSGHPVHDTVYAGKHTAAESIPVRSSKHVECVDCHNPHAARTPDVIPGSGNAGRVTGMKYVDIKGAVQSPPPVGTRQPYIYEVCFKCHGDSYTDVFGTNQPYPDVVQNREGNTGHFSNKRKEFNPESHHYMNYPGGDIGYNTSYHPVAAPGRNGTLNLCKQLENAFGLDCSSASAAATSLSNLTINCTDCHNNEDTAPALTNPVTVRGPVTESSLRSTDKASAYSPSTAPVGPHGSNRNRLLRGNYLTTNSYSGAFGAGWYSANRLDTNGRPKFELCFLCHEESRLVNGAYTNFGGTATSASSYAWSANLHNYHLNSQAVCHDCHHNVHSNVEAQNTIYGNGLGAQLPPDSMDGLSDGKISTHLLNFGPQATGQTASKPRWYYDFSYLRCNLVCHGYSMSLCNYNYGGSSGGRTADGGWCA